MNTTCYAYYIDAYLIIQAFMLPLTHAGAVRRVVLVYKDWLHVCTHNYVCIKVCIRGFFGEQI